MSAAAKTQRLLRLTIKLYRGPQRPGGEGHDFARDYVVKDHDVTVEFYFRSFAELNRVNSDPEFQELQASEELYVNRVHTVVSLAWVEQYAAGGKVVNIDKDKSTYPSWDELADLSDTLDTDASTFTKL